MSKKHIPLLLDEPVITVYPSLAKALGNINKAVILQQVHFLLNIAKQSDNQYNFVNDRWWVYNTYEQWHEKYFTWLSVSTIKGLFLALEEDGLISSVQGVKNKLDRRKWYTINYAKFEELVQCIGQKLSDEETKNVQWEGQEVSDVIRNTENTEDSTDKKDKKTPSAGSGSVHLPYPAEYKRWTAKHIEQYHGAHGAELDQLVQAWHGGMYQTALEMPLFDAREAIETYQELSKQEISPEQYPAICKHVRNTLAWQRAGIKLGDMRREITSFKLKQPRPKIITDDPALDLSIPEPVIPILMQREKIVSAAELEDAS